MDSMLAASLPSPGSLTLVRRPLPILGPRDVLLSIEATTLCGTDLRIVTGQKTHGVTPGVILGHEIAARVEARRGPSPRNRRARTGNPGGPRPGNRLRPLRALHGRTFKRLREHGALWNRSGRRARRRYPRTRTGAGMHHPAPARLHHHSWPWPNPSHAVCVPALTSPSPQPRVSSSWAQAPSASSTARSLPPRARPSWRAGDPRAWIPRSPSARVP